ncbi:hypothetical protein MRGA423_00975 [Mycobacterium tuberculosis RGTB423]|nr:hypothetical protein MRGA423_00975 [Mycobacterium tuberculosis RGTB423]
MRQLDLRERERLRGQRLQVGREVKDAFLCSGGQGIGDDLRRHVRPQPERRSHIGVARRVAVVRVAVAQVDDHLQVRLDQVGQRISDDRHRPQRLQQRPILGADDVVVGDPRIARRRR